MCFKFYIEKEGCQSTDIFHGKCYAPTSETDQAEMFTEN